MSARPDASTPLARWLGWLGHSGYVAEGVFYALLGGFALMAAFVLLHVVLGLLDPEHRGERPTVNRRAMRRGYLRNGALRSVLVGEAVWRLLGFCGAADGPHSQAVWTARAMALPLGR